jgi:predicted MFS family arabinose efflux permease
MLVATSGLVGAQLAPDKSWATLPQSTWVIGTALTTLPLSMAMKHIGRRIGFLIGSLAGIVAGSLGLVAIFKQSFALFLIATLFMGLYQASSSYYRFAAADSASPAFRPKAISWVMTGGVVAALIGTLLVMGTVNLLAPVTFAGSYLAMAILAGLATILLLVLKDPGPAQMNDEHAEARPLGEIVSQPRYMVAVVLGMMSYGIMVLVMTATPVAMLGCNFTVNDSSWVIQWHALAMFVPSFFTGSLIARYGADKVAAAGMFLLIGAAIAGLMGIRFENFAIGLILLGLGWNFGFIGATTMLTTTYRPSERNKAQGVNDLLVFVTTAISSLAAGKLLAGIGWNAVNYAVFPMTVVGLAMIVWIVRHPARPA